MNSNINSSARRSGFVLIELSKEDKARRELEITKRMSGQAKRRNEDMQAELVELDQRRKEINNRILQNGREIRAYADREQTLTQFLALAEEI